MKSLLVLLAMIGSVMCGEIDVGLKVVGHGGHPLVDVGAYAGHPGPVYLGHAHGYDKYSGHGNALGHGHGHGLVSHGYGGHHGHAVALAPVIAHGHGHGLGHGHGHGHPAVRTYSAGFDFALGGNHGIPVHHGHGGHGHGIALAHGHGHGHGHGLGLGAGHFSGHSVGLGHGHGYAQEVVKTVVKTPVLKKAVVPVVSAHNYDYNAFKPIVKTKHVVHKEPAHYAPTDYEIVPSISYGYSYKLVPTHNYGPTESHHGHKVHHPVPVAKAVIPVVSVSHHSEPDHAHGHGHGHGHGLGHGHGHGAGHSLGLDFGLDIGHGGHHH